MKIGILSSGNDMLTLFSFLQRYDHHYHVWYDDAFLFWGDKSVDVVMDRVAQGIEFLHAKGVDVILVPPMVELKIRNEKLFPKTTILPLFVNYVQKHCFAYSLTGKIGYFGDWFDAQECQQQLKILAQDYVLSDNQRSIKKFHFPFAYWGKEVRNWKYLLDTVSWSMPLVHNMVKHDLRYFKDARVDTIIPCNYAYFSVQKAIDKARYTDMRFYGIETLEEIFVSYTEKTSSEYSVSLYFTGHGEFLKQQKRLLWLLARGKSITLDFVQL